MAQRIASAGLALVLAAFPMIGHAQTNAQRGAAEGAQTGASVLGEIGAAVGSAAGAAVGTAQDIANGVTAPQTTTVKRKTCVTDVAGTTRCDTVETTTTN